MEFSEYKAAIVKALSLGQPAATVARQIYLSYPTYSFSGKPDREFSIKNAISTEFRVAISDIHFGGSGKTGESYHKKNQFIPGHSDLDAAIINNRLYLEFLEQVVVITDGFKDLTGYDKRVDELDMFLRRLQQGILIPEYMPLCAIRARWQQFFEALSAGNTDLFKDINCWIYSTQMVYEWKVSRTINLLLSEVQQ